MARTSKIPRADHSYADAHSTNVGAGSTTNLRRGQRHLDPHTPNAAADPSFDLRALVRRVQAESEVTDLATLAKAVDQAIPEHARDAALAQALPALVSSVVSTTRQHTTISRVPAQRSGKVSGFRRVGEHWRKALEDWMHVGPETSDWKALGDCTAADLDFIAEDRDATARRYAARADGARHLRDLLAEHDAATVRELPEQVLAATLVRSES